MDADPANAIASFCEITGANPTIAQTTLAAADWKLDEAVALYFAGTDDTHAEPDADMDDDNARARQPQSATPPSATPTSSSRPARRPPGQRPKTVTLGDLQRGADDEDTDEEKDPDLYTGGEKSGLAVENPNGRGASGPADHFNKIMQQARANRDRPAGDDDAAEQQQPARSTHFSGRAQTLGGDDAPSQVVEDPAVAARAPGGRGMPPPRAARVNRTLHLWADGVSIDDGPLFRFDDPANGDIMEQINQGRAPLSLLDVQPGQEVDLNLDPHKDENYTKPKTQYKPFGGQGQRLGSPTPGPNPSSSSSTASTAQPAAAPLASATSAASSPAVMPVDDSTPTLTLQIRLGDGTRLQSRFNTSHTIGDVYAFVNRASATSSQRSYALMTTFPSKELDDKARALGEMAEFRRGGVVVQKWK
ncbi:hypothetical protein LTR08_007346 [Meristemomyces frigidus]|nr:hypothetical protein LTR08_007346 [Meristemomyces frigidus]